ncbi:E3 ubiquitin-protein ligase RNF220 [Nymphon striatum]|nr:E3 ubiquitin-protein ligase RNF220 [Nymphon striatum]
MGSVLGVYKLVRGKKRLHQDGQSSCCPVCSVTVRPQDLLHHFQLETERLQQISKTVKRSVSRETSSHGRNITSPPARRRRDSPSTSSSETKSASRWDFCISPVKACKSGKRCKRICEDSGASATPGAVASACPVCGEKLCCNADEMNIHVDMCLNKKDILDEENIDVEGNNDRFEEYEWAGQRRIRATSLLEGGFEGSGITLVSKPKVEDEDEGDLNVDVDDSATYGTSQYTEADIIPCKSNEIREQKQRDALRDAVMGSDRYLICIPYFLACSSGADVVEADQATKDSSENISESKNILDSLKSKIKELDASNTNIAHFKCLICMEQYTNPLVSVCCWHVHCEECWLRTLGAKKLCPQCNMITSPTDLRRVYL